METLGRFGEEMKMKWYEKEGYEEGKLYFCEKCNHYFIFGQKHRIEASNLENRLCPICNDNACDSVNG